MMELLDREKVLNCFHDWIDKYGDVHTADEMTEYIAIEALPVEHEIIYCKDCKWWDKMQNLETRGYCHAAKHVHLSRNWEISIYRTTGRMFYCAEAERREDG